MELQNTFWNSNNKLFARALGKVNEDFFEFIKKLPKSKKAAFKQETDLIQHYMYHCHYGGTFTCKYSRLSLLCVIMKRSPLLPNRRDDATCGTFEALCSYGSLI